MLTKKFVKMLFKKDLKNIQKINKYNNKLIIIKNDNNKKYSKY